MASCSAALGSTRRRRAWAGWASVRSQTGVVARASTIGGGGGEEGGPAEAGRGGRGGAEEGGLAEDGRGGQRGDGLDPAVGEGAGDDGGPFDQEGDVVVGLPALQQRRADRRPALDQDVEHGEPGRGVQVGQPGGGQK